MEENVVDLEDDLEEEKKLFVDTELVTNLYKHKKAMYEEYREKNEYLQ